MPPASGPRDVHAAERPEGHVRVEGGCDPEAAVELQDEDERAVEVDDRDVELRPLDEPSLVDDWLFVGDNIICYGLL